MTVSSRSFNSEVIQMGSTKKTEDSDLVVIIVPFVAGVVVVVFVFLTCCAYRSRLIVYIAVKMFNQFSAYHMGIGGLVVSKLGSIPAAFRLF